MDAIKADDVGPGELISVFSRHKARLQTALLLPNPINQHHSLDYTVDA